MPHCLTHSTPVGCRDGFFVAVTVLCLLATAVSAQAPESGYDKLWSHAQLYTGDSDATVESIRLSGRVQFDAVTVDSGDRDFSDVDLRRFRFGVRMDFANNLRVHAEGTFDPNGADLGYRGLTDAYVAWMPSDALNMTLGKHSVSFTMDGHTSSKELITIDRSNLANNIWFTQEYIPGISVSGEKSGISYNVGIFSSGPKDRGFGGSSGGEFVLATIGHDFSDKSGVDKALLRFDFVDNEPDPNNSFTQPLERIGSLNFDFETGQWGFRADLSSAKGYLGQSDLSGLMLMPYYNFSDKLQVVARYTYLDSDDENGIRFARYEREVVDGRGDEYSELYLGLNYYWYGHKLKLQTGLTYADMDDRAADGGAYTGWGWTTGFRVSW